MILSSITGATRLSTVFVQSTSLTSFLNPRYWPTWLGLGFFRLLSVLPLPIVAILGQGIGLVFYALGASRRRIAFRNISACFPEFSAAECQLINRRHYQMAGQALLATPMNWWISQKRYNKLVTVHGRDDYDSALSSGRNIILLAPHFAAIEVPGHILAQERPMLSMYQYAKNGLIDELVRRGRTRFGGVMVERKAPMRNLIRAIRQGHPFYYLPDQDAGSKGVFVPFFHELASTYSMLGKFAEMTDALVIPCRTRIRPWGRGYDIFLNPALENFPSGDEFVDTARMNEEVANLIRPNPEQYFWVHKRFKTRPPEEVDKGVKFYK